ncbi:Cytochrome c oxidase copper chaperone [Datura stramonium]|uniref:Cytochrome c oxidase copper chaperone n=1 Tax=Datura stramonium TaxID=4076 RepID=A0ABS8W2J3_DATST|nr:Cytochrome c oxidase copper chaperone [Datura stramonium]
MGGLPIETTSTAISLSKLPKDQKSAASTMSDSKPKKKICCACPETKKLRDECIVEHGESACEKWIEAHRKCLRAEGFKIGRSCMFK